MTEVKKQTAEDRKQTMEKVLFFNLYIYQSFVCCLLSVFCFLSSITTGEIDYD